MPVKQLKKIKKNILRWGPSGITILIVLYATLWPDPVGAEDTMLFPGADKLIHAIMMGGISSAILFDFRRSGKRLTNKLCLSVLLSVALFSLFDECAQHFMALGRSFEWTDLCADFCGTALGIILGRPVINRIFKKG